MSSLMLDKNAILSGQPSINDNFISLNGNQLDGTDHRSDQSPTNSDPTSIGKLPDSNSESSQISPSSHDEFPQDLSLPKTNSSSTRFNSDPGIAPKEEPCIDEGLIQINQEGQLTPNGQFPNKIFNPEAYCDICNKEFYNKYFLQSHKVARHSLTSMSGLSFLHFPQHQQYQQSSIVNAPSSMTTTNSFNSIGFPLIPPPPPPPPPVPIVPSSTIGAIDHNDSSLSSIIYCPLCSQSMDSRLNLQTHLMTAHTPMFGSATLQGGPNGAFNSLYMPHFGSGTGSVPAIGNTDLPFNGITSPYVPGLPSELFGSLNESFPMPSFSSAVPIFNSNNNSNNNNSNNINSSSSCISATNGKSTNGLSALAAALAQTSTIAPLSLANESLFAGQVFPSPHQQQQQRSHDAYCDVCEKEYCNKYFLRVHRQKSHGLSPEKTPDKNGVSNRLASPQTEKTSTSPPQTTFVGHGMPTSVIVPTYEARCFSPEKKVPKLDHDVKPKSSLDLLLANAVGSSLSNAGQIQCDMCIRDFPSLFSMATHKLREHGAASATTTTTTTITTATTTAETTTSTGVSNLNATLLSETSPSKALSLSTTYCQLCDKEFRSTFFLGQHLANYHQQLTLEHSPKITPSFFAEQPSVINLAQSPRPLQMSDNNGLGNFYAKQSKKTYSTGRNYCDLCNKEVCNKYFLRTHMLKMHRIVIDENKTIIANINTIEKEKSGSLSFRCDICLDNLTSRHLLKVHKQEAHGILPLTTSSAAASVAAPFAAAPSGSRSIIGVDGSVSHMLPTMVDMLLGNSVFPPNVTVSAGEMTADAQPASPYISYGNFTEVCPVCDGRFKSTGLLQTHMKREHSNEVAPDVLASFEKTAEQNDQQSEASLKCDYCCTQFSDIIDHQLHLIREHSGEIRAKTSTMAADSLMASFNDDQQAVRDIRLNVEKMTRYSNFRGNKTYNCAFCNYSTPWPSNLSTHEKRHTFGTPNSDKPYTCQVCFREYRYAHSLARHREVHRTAAFYERKFNERRLNLSSSPEKNGREPVSPSKLTRRFRCRECDKRFRTRDQCREHLFAAHRRPNQIPDGDSLKISTTTNEGEESETNAVVRSIVESLHQQQIVERKRRDIQLQTASPRPPLEGFAVPMTENDDGKSRPYTLQCFRMQTRSEKNGFPTAVFDDLFAYLPVRTRLYQPIDISFKLMPMSDSDARIEHL